jgi:hypothetical protein
MEDEMVSFASSRAALVSAGLLAALSLTTAKGQEKTTPTVAACEIARSDLAWSRKDLRQMQENLASSGISKASPSAEVIISPDIRISKQDFLEFTQEIFELQKLRINEDLEKVEKECSDAPVAIGQKSPKLPTLHS